jgi:hypothetical protein
MEVVNVASSNSQYTHWLFFSLIPFVYLVFSDTTDKFS